MPSKKTLVSRCRIAKKLKRYNDMFMCIRAVAQSGAILNKKERNLYYLSYQYMLRSYRTGWYKLLVITELIDGSRRKMELTKDYKLYVERQWMEYCMEGVNNIDSILMPRVTRARPKIFYLKMRADLTRYIVEISVGARRKRLVRETTTSYQEASELADEKLAPLNPLRLSTALNFAVFYGHSLDKKEMALITAKAAVTEAEKQLEKMESRKGVKRSLNLMQLLRDNIAFWEPNDTDEEEINEPILKGELMKEAKNLRLVEDLNEAGLGGGGGGVDRGETGGYPSPTLVDEYEAEEAAENEASAGQALVVETFHPPTDLEEPLDEFDFSDSDTDSEDEDEEEDENEDEDEEDADVFWDDDEDDGEEEDDEKEEEEEEETRGAPAVAVAVAVKVP